MAKPEADERSVARRARDEEIAQETPLAPPQLSVDAVPQPMESHLGKLRRRPVAVAGVVENGLVRPLDPTVKLQEHSRVIIVAADGV